MLVAYKSRPEETKAMRDAFKAYDIDQNGYVGREEFMGVLRNQGYQDEEVKKGWTGQGVSYSERAKRYKYN